jgi:spectinomycin phosphotransferase
MLELPLVLCHADIHTNNVLVGGDADIWIVDWDETMLAPRERDLMFVVGGISRDFVDARREALFFDGYGDVELNQAALAYYRYAWAVSDVAAYGEQVFLRPDLGAKDQREAAERLSTLFEPGEIVEIALESRV